MVEVHLTGIVSMSIDMFLLVPQSAFTWFCLLCYRLTVWVVDVIYVHVVKSCDITQYQKKVTHSHIMHFSRKQNFYINISDIYLFTVIY